MKFHPDVLAAHAEFGGDLNAMQALYDRPDNLARIAELETKVERLTNDLTECSHRLRQQIDRTKAVEAVLAERAGGVRGEGRPDARWGKVVRPVVDPEDHWLARLALVDDVAETEPVRAKPQTLKRLTPRKGD